MTFLRFSNVFSMQRLAKGAIIGVPIILNSEWSD